MAKKLEQTKAIEQRIDDHIALGVAIDAAEAVCPIGTNPPPYEPIAPTRAVKLIAEADAQSARQRAKVDVAVRVRGYNPAKAAKQSRRK